MNLWYKPIDQVTFADVDAFCQSKHREALRLDYKLTFPNDLAKLVAAFANTLGGIILLGVEADKATNEPIWPPANGMPQDVGIEERIVAICRDNLYPPVRPEVSSVLPHDLLPGHVVVVVRVHPSPEAPHATSDGRHIYERTGNQVKPYTHTHIDRIVQLLDRRRRLEEQRNEMIAAELSRASRLMHVSGKLLASSAGLEPLPGYTEQDRRFPRRWAAVTPFYPWQDVCTAARCKAFHSSTELRGDRVHSVPGGSISTRGINPGEQRSISSYSAMNTRGQVFAMEFTMEAVNEPRQIRHCVTMSRESTWNFTLGVCQCARDFYSQKNVELPGYLLLSLGVTDAFGGFMKYNTTPGFANFPATGRSFVDHEFRAEIPIHIAQLLDNPEGAAWPLFEELSIGFDLPVPVRP